MANYGLIEFRSARASGILINHLGSGVPDHVSMFGAGGPLTAIEVNAWNATSYITDSAGTVPAYLGEGSGCLTNVKYISANTATVSGLPLGPYTKTIVNINKFNVDNLNPAKFTYPNFANRPSGTLMVRYIASGTADVHTYNAKLWAYDVDTNINTAPPDITMMGFEINASGKWYNTTQSGVWNNMGGAGSPLYFADHSPRNGYPSKHEHIWVAALSARPLAVGALNCGLVFSMQYV